ncbi:uncharacterized protein LOC110443811 [Mizuhopecten yessoensis]|uniref:Uncharacterized protein n=1 Tax=Mizuhopecten yessoensis TaxID=6573 RepID=A0A210PE48_MIZYE|nr:uncharacterized protein LOC110443811 [Mizuhopecten yessoensis]OWF34747.1 hypothetical protein KP79_PYT14145 [Mizuhopecten yessoensis]
MPAGGQGDRALYGHVGHPQNMNALLDTITKLKQDLAQSHAEKQNLAGQMNVLITLVKRSWSGDFNASLHLGNIIGLQPPEFMQPYQDGKRTTNTPIPEIKEKVVRAWERLAIKLLDREYAQIQEEIYARQQVYMQNRQLYMDEVMHNHEHDMAKTTVPLRNRHKTYEEVDKQFLKTVGTNQPQSRPTSGTSTRGRIRSAQKQQRPNVKENNPDVTLNDLFVQPTGDRNKNSAFSGLYQMENGRDNRNKYRAPYDDPQRYKQTNLFNLDAVFGPDVGVKKPRPASAFTATTNKDKVNNQKPRPKSASVFVTQLHDRPLKYEVTHPVSNKPSTKKKPAQKQRLKSASVPKMNIIQEQGGDETPEQDTESLSSYQQSHDSPPSAPVATPAPDNPDNFDVNSETDFNQGVDDVYREDAPSSPGLQQDRYSSDSSDEEPPEDHIGEHLRVRVGSATNKPKSVAKFVTDMKVMEDMEKDFKKSAATLQKRLGIADMGMIK